MEQGTDKDVSWPCPHLWGALIVGLSVHSSLQRFCFGLVVCGELGGLQMLTLLSLVTLCLLQQQIRPLNLLHSCSELLSWLCPQSHLQMHSCTSPVKVSYLKSSCWESSDSLPLISAQPWKRRIYGQTEFSRGRLCVWVLSMKTRETCLS